MPRNTIEINVTQCLKLCLDFNKCLLQGKKLKFRDFEVLPSDSIDMCDIFYKQKKILSTDSALIFLQVLINKEVAFDVDLYLFIDLICRDNAVFSSTIKRALQTIKNNQRDNVISEKPRLRKPKQNTKKANISDRFAHLSNL